MKNKTVIKLKTIPINSSIAERFGKTDYCDSFRVIKSTNDSIESITAVIFKVPNWVLGLMKIRNFVVRNFGLKTKKSPNKKDITFFAVIEYSENEIIMEECNKHLDFRTSALIDRENSFIYLTTLVHFNNIGGHLYFILVKPFHKIIIQSLLNPTIFIYYSG